MTTMKQTQDRAAAVKHKPTESQLDKDNEVGPWQALHTAQNAPDLLKSGDVLQLQRAIGIQAT
jgi:hypothetical protein